MQKRMPRGALFGLGCLATALIFLLITRYDDFIEEYALNLLIGAIGSVLGVIMMSAYSTLTSFFELGLRRRIKYLPSLKSIYAECEQLINDLVQSRTSKKSIQVTAMVRKETRDDPAESDQYMNAIRRLLDTASKGEGSEEPVYRMMGEFSTRDEVQGRLSLFGSEGERLKHLRVRSFNEAWPVDLLVTESCMVIVFRNHAEGDLSWGLRVKDDRIAKRARRWLRLLWESNLTKEVWNGREITL